MSGLTQPPRELNSVSDCPESVFLLQTRLLQRRIFIQTNVVIFKNLTKQKVDHT